MCLALVLFYSNYRQSGQQHNHSAKVAFCRKSAHCKRIKTDSSVRPIRTQACPTSLWSTAMVAQRQRFTERGLRLLDISRQTYAHVCESSNVKCRTIAKNAHIECSFILSKNKHKYIVSYEPHIVKCVLSRLSHHKC